MKILITAVDFYPDNTSVAQHLFDLANHLVKNGFTVDVISSAYSYENKHLKYSNFEIFNKIKISRVNFFKTGNKNSIISRIIDTLFFYFSFLFFLIFKNKEKYNFIICTTSPPMFSFFINIYSKLNNAKFCFWVMDMQPELSIETNLLKRNSLISKLLFLCNKLTFNLSFKIITLDRYMTNYLVNSGCKENKIFTTPVWTILENHNFPLKNHNPFAIKYGLINKTVIMYSGNHSFVHPLNTILETAALLKNDSRFLFVFIGNGVRVKEVSIFKDNNNLNNILQLPYQTRDNIKYSLSSGDLHVVVMGDNLVGFTHPNKIYGSLFVGKPIIYIGPNNSHITDILEKLNGNIVVNNNDPVNLSNKLIQFSNLTIEERNEIGNRNRKYLIENFNPELLKDNMLKIFKD